MRWHRLLQMMGVMFIPFFLSGCWSSLELRNTGMVTGIGIDKLENGQYRLILQLLSATDKEGEKEASSSPIMLSQTGTSLFEMERGLIRDAKRRLMFMHTKVILMGESAARDNVLWPLDTWTRDTQPPLNGYLLISKEDVSSISDTPTGFPENPFFAWSKGMDNLALQRSRIHCWTRLKIHVKVEEGFGC
ncbi:hypothetical protein LLE49_24995, partial [Alicyclobacillus tolerans]|uniref:Ger(x)C family spore germination protein n=1 Tax=Alicyclobacillus tolerans TaxID=90970 RepID=UPI001F1FB0A0